MMNWQENMIRLDELDMQILRLLQRDGRMAFSDMAKELGVSQGTVRNRVNRLLETNSIQIAAYPNPNTLGRDKTRAFIGIKVEQGHLSDVVDALCAYSQVRYLGVTAGTHDIVVLTEMRSNDELLHFITRDLGHIPGIKDTHTSLILDVAKSLGVVIEHRLGKEQFRQQDDA